MGLNIFKTITTSILRDLRKSNVAPNADRIYTPGEKEWETSRIRERDGIPISEELKGVIDSVSKEYNVEKPY